MKYGLIIIACLTLTNMAFSQETKEALDKMTEFASKTGVIVKFEDYELPGINLLYGKAQTKVRKLTSGHEARTFYQISYEGKYGTKTASIAYEDLLEIQKAMATLKDQSTADIDAPSDYLENKFVTEDGFKIGYYVSKSKLTWYMVLEKYGSNNTIFIKSAGSIDEALKQAKIKMNSLH